MKALRLLFVLLIVAFGCAKDSGSDSDNEYEDPRFFGYMEAKVNGELKTWENTRGLSYGTCDPLFPTCVAGCFHSIMSLYGSTLPEVAETITIGWNLSEDYGCEDYNASFTISQSEGMLDYGSRDICEDDDPTTPRYICHDVSFTITPVGNSIYKGTFSFVASRNCGAEEVVITDGKFEVEIKGELCDGY